MLAALLGAIVWNLLTWWLGLPSQLVARADRRPRRRGARRSRARSGVQWHGLVHKVLIPALIAPALAFGGAFLLLLGSSGSSSG